MQQPYDILMIGHFARDRNVVDGNGRVESGGGVYFGSVVATRLGLRVAVVTRLHPDDFPYLEELRQEGIAVFARPAPQTSGIENIYNSADMEQRICKPLGFAGPFLPEDIPAVSARLYAIVPIIAGEVDMNLLRLLAARGPIALDVQGFVRVREGNDLVFRPWPEMAQGLQYVTYLKADRAEAELLTGQKDLAAAAKQLAAYGPKEVIITESAGITVFADGEIFRAPFLPRSLKGRTGRGDTCFAAYLAGRLQALPAEATHLAGLITSRKLEHPGPWRGPLAG